MASTYEPIATTTITNGTTSTVTFNSIPSTYTDLVVVFNGGGETGGGNVQFKINNDTGANYSFTIIRADGTTASSDRESNFTGYFRWGAYATPTTAYSTIDFAHFMNYSNSTTYKTILTRTGNASGGTDATAVLWQSTSAITRLDLTFAAYWKNGSTFTIYGIKAA
jgi:hypothetical protein